MSSRRKPPPKERKDEGMKIAVAYDNGEIFQHFGHTAVFKLYDAENGAVREERLLPTGESGHGALAGLLSQNGVDTLICGGIGAGAQAALAAAGIRLYGGVSGSSDEAVKALLNGTLPQNAAANCDHHSGQCGHHHEHDGQCGGGSCGSR